MTNKIKNIVVICTMAILIFGLSVTCFLKDADEYSSSERRLLAQMPEISFENILSGKFMSDFDEYTLDQFPLRDQFRTIKAVSAFYVFRQKDNNDIYIVGDHASKMEYPLNQDMIDIAVNKFQYLYDTYMAESNCNIHFSVVPDKNVFYAEENGYLSIDYDYLQQTMKERLPFAQYTDIFPLLSYEDYYTTDHHWRQEKILDVAGHLAEKLGVELTENYTEKTLDVPFYGVYYGQAALPLAPDTIKYLTNDILESCTVTSYDNGKATPISVYTLDKANSNDPYEIFLNGADPLIIIENPKAATEKELVVFRDSFGSSIVPLLVSGYSKITLVDIRYMPSNILTGYENQLGFSVDFNNSDVLFLYSTLILNSANILK